MRGHRCIRCRKAWAGDTGPEERFQYITKFCPECVEKFPQARFPLIRQGVRPLREARDESA